jgi:CRISPR/Cas system CSM-associated protein Csm3 (group 7 of RAMP superfamily)
VTYFELVGRADGTIRDHLRLFAESLSRAFYDDAPLVPPSTWHGAFRALGDAIERRRARKGKVVLFFDELPWIATHRSGVLAALEHFLERLVFSARRHRAHRLWLRCVMDVAQR